MMGLMVHVYRVRIIVLRVVGCLVIVRRARCRVIDCLVSVIIHVLVYKGTLRI